MPRKCTVCHHPQRREIDLSLLSHVPLSSLAKQYHLSPSALSRHHHHLRQKVQEAGLSLQKQRQQEELAKLHRLLHLVHSVAEATFAAGDHNLFLKSAREITVIFKLLPGLPDNPTTLGLYQLLTSPRWPSQGLALSAAPEFCQDERRLIAQNFAQPCHDLGHLTLGPPEAELTPQLGASPQKPDQQPETSPAAPELVAPALPAQAQDLSDNPTNRQDCASESTRNREGNGTPPTNQRQKEHPTAPLRPGAKITLRRKPPLPPTGNNPGCTNNDAPAIDPGCPGGLASLAYDLTQFLADLFPDGPPPFIPPTRQPDLPDCYRLRRPPGELLPR